MTATKTATRTILSIALLSLAAAACADVDAPNGETEGDLSVRSSFDVFEGENGRYYFNFSAGNHEIILSSQGYASRTGALAGVLAVLDNALDESSFNVKATKSGGAHFNLVAANGEIIASSEVYSTMSNARRGVKSVVRNIGDYLAFSARRSGARFVVFEGESGRYFYQLRAKNGEVVLRSQSYATEAGALNGTFSVADNGLETSSFEVLAAANGGFYFNLVAGNGEIIGSSEIYSTKSNATRGVRAMIALLPDVELL